MTAFLALVATVSMSLALYMVLIVCILGICLGCKMALDPWFGDPWWQLPLGLVLIVVCLSGSIWTAAYISTGAPTFATQEKA